MVYCKSGELLLSKGTVGLAYKKFGYNEQPTTLFLSFRVLD